MRPRDLLERDRRRFLMHLLSLGEADRQLRFGAYVSDETITRYVQHIDFHRDAVFGIQDDHTVLVGVGHLAFIPRDTFCDLGHITAKQSFAEFGVSVLESARRKGLGAALFERAVCRCQNEDIDLLYMPCLNDNAAAVSLARKAGMEIRQASGRTYLKLPAAEVAVVQPMLHSLAEVAPLPSQRISRSRRR